MFPNIRPRVHRESRTDIKFFKYVSKTIQRLTVKSIILLESLTMLLKITDLVFSDSSALMFSYHTLTAHFSPWHHDHQHIIRQVTKKRQKKCCMISTQVKWTFINLAEFFVHIQQKGGVNEFQISSVSSTGSKPWQSLNKQKQRKHLSTIQTLVSVANNTVAVCVH